MGDSFIYRKKSGFVPPFANWLTATDFNHEVRNIILERIGYILEIVPRKIIEEMLSDTLNGKRLRDAILNFLWGAIFT